MCAKIEAMLSAAKEFVGFVNRSPSPYHAVDECRKLLVAAGFRELKETESWNLKPSDKCFVTRNQSTMVAFAVGGKFQPGNGFSIVGAHTDSPCLKVKPVSRRVKQGYLQVGVETYGGGTWHTWFDRDLKVAGRVMIKTASGLEHRLVHVNRPILRLPDIAIHLHRELGQKFEFNKETHFSPVLATTAAEEMLNKKPAEDSEPKTKKQSDKHHPILINLLAEELKVSADSIWDFELCLADHADGVIGGALNEFIFAARLDNLISTYCAVQALVNSSTNDTLQQDPNIRIITLFDNEEVGSDSAQGAGSTLTELLLRRMSAGGSATAFEEAVPKSMLLSCDVAHAVHPNYAEKHEENHKPAFHGGMVVKFNANQRYATTAITTAMFREVAARADVPLQDFVIRQDMACGSTIGPIMSSKLGMATVDIGPPLLSMHSIREMIDTSSVMQTTDIFQKFFESFPDVFASTQI